MTNQPTPYGVFEKGHTTYNVIDMDRLSNYDYELPEELIAGEPRARRDDSRLLVVDRDSGRIVHRTIRDLPELLQAGDCLVLNDTRVIPARLLGRRAATGGKWEGLFLGCTKAGTWRLMGQCRGKPSVGERITVIRAHDNVGQAFQPAAQQ